MTTALRDVAAIVREGLLPHKRSAVSAMVLDAVGLSLRGWVLAQVVWYARLLEQDGAVSILGAELHARTSPELLLGTAGLVLVLMAAAASIEYAAVVLAVRTAMLHEESCTRQVLRAAAERGVDPARVVSLAIGGARAAARSVLGVQTLIPALVAVTLTLPILAWLSPRTFLIVLGPAAVGVVAVVRLRRRAEDVTEEMQSLRPAVRAAMTEALEHAQERDDPAVAADAAATGATGRARTAFGRRLTAVSRSRLAVNLCGSLVVAVGVTDLGAQALSGGVGWGVMLAWLLALRYTLGRTTEAGAALTAIGLQAPQMGRLRAFLAGADPDTLDLYDDIDDV